MSQDLFIPSIRIQNLRPEDVSHVAFLHHLIFPDYFLTHLGYPFLKRFYGEFVDYPGNYGLVAVQEGRIVGFVVGTVNSPALYKHLYRQHFFPLILIFIARFLTDPFVRRHITSRMQHFRLAFQALFGRNRRQSTAASPSFNSSAASARLLSIGVHPAMRGNGVANFLIDDFCQRLRRDNVAQVGLSVRVENERAISFYKKTGWERERATETLLYFRRST